MQSKFALQIECFLFVLCSKSKNIPGRNKKSPKTLHFGKSSGKGFIGLRKYHQGLVTGLVLVPGVSSPHPETDGLKVISAASLVNFKV